MAQRFGQRPSSLLGIDELDDVVALSFDLAIDYRLTFDAERRRQEASAHARHPSATIAPGQRYETLADLRSRRIH